MVGVDSVIVGGKEIPYMARLHTYVYFDRGGDIIADIEFFDVILNNLGFDEIDIGEITLEVEHKKPDVYGGEHLRGERIALTIV